MRSLTALPCSGGGLPNWSASRSPCTSPRWRSGRRSASPPRPPPTTFEALIYPVLGALLYATFLQVPFTALRAAFADRRFLLAALALNFVVVPPIAFALSRLAPGGRAVELGVLMVLLTPCIDYVIVFTRLAGGSDRRLLAAAPLLMLAQMALLPLYLWLFMGPELADIVEPGAVPRGVRAADRAAARARVGDRGLGGARRGRARQARRGPAARSR